VGVGGEQRDTHRRAADPVIDYLGTEDSFGFSWGAGREFAGLRNGITHVGRSPSAIGIFRFHDAAPIRFESSLDLRLDWTSEFTVPDIELVRRMRAELVDFAADPGRLWVDYATTTYWYQDRVGHDHAPMPALADRVARLLRSNEVPEAGSTPGDGRGDSITPS
jgi:hypothetical protein